MATWKPWCDKVRLRIRAEETKIYMASIQFKKNLESMIKNLEYRGSVTELVHGVMRWATRLLSNLITNWRLPAGPGDH